ncbi:dirigent protein 22-like [Punica granatum]|uniref:Dirigent protein n=2 Tax=Punica granatum TaxID=22663 RepID=A0A218XCI2_PUNGR|nr:dirigent protein 22-like [Punica granatum]OWM82634.1 hypothetical protein CDL15_Pgr002209 [Punica granatum]PKI32823.1 hypothetical protein CRG98_046816 [Punica granatum]
MAMIPAKLFLSDLFFSSSLLDAKSSDPEFATSTSPEQLGLNTQKLTHIRFFLHERNNAPNQTAVQVAQAATTSQSPSFFGAVAVIDDLLTEGPDMGSKLIGRLQGMTASADQSEIALLMATNFVFTAGKYNGSTLTMLGRNRLGAPLRELPIVGGTGHFRFARGYVKTSTRMLDRKTGIVLAEYNLYVLHYY